MSGLRPRAGTDRVDLGRRALTRAFTEDPGWVEWLRPADLKEWEMYELLNRRAVAMYALEADEEYFAKRSERKGVLGRKHG